MNNGLTKEQCDKLLVNCFKIDALAKAISENTEGEDCEASNLADCVFDYNRRSVDILSNGHNAKNKEAPETGKAPGIVEDALYYFNLVFSRLQPISEIYNEGILDDNPQGKNILAEMVEKTLEPLETGIRILTDAYSDLKKAPEAQPESKTSEA